MSTEGPPRETKHHGLISRPQVAFDYLQFAAGIDIHNHVRTGSRGYEDAWLTKCPHIRQFAGLMGFLFTNAFLAIKYFEKKSDLRHYQFKMSLVNEMLSFDSRNMGVQRRSSLLNTTTRQQESFQELKHLRDAIGVEQKPCYFCQHGRATAQKNKTRWFCGHVECGVKFPICSSTIRSCFSDHIHEGGIPGKKRRLQK